MQMSHWAVALTCGVLLVVSTACGPSTYSRATPTLAPITRADPGALSLGLLNAADVGAGWKLKPGLGVDMPNGVCATFPPIPYQTTVQVGYEKPGSEAHLFETITLYTRDDAPMLLAKERQSMATCQGGIRVSPLKLPGQPLGDDSFAYSQVFSTLRAAVLLIRRGNAVAVIDYLDTSQLSPTVIESLARRADAKFARAVGSSSH